MREARDGDSRILQYVRAIFRAEGRDFTTCELCGGDTEDRPQLHHKKYDGATIGDIAIVCISCNMLKENKGLA